MINLLPAEDFRELHAARHNVLLIRFLMSAVFCLVCIIFAISASYMLIKKQEESALTAKQDSEHQLNQYREAEKETAAFKSNLTIAKQILDKSISYRTMMINIAQLLPENAIITNLQLSPDSINKPSAITINTKSYEDAVKVKDALNSSKIARDVSLGGVSTTATDNNGTQAPEKYPVSAQLNLTFTDKLLIPMWESASTGAKS